jgi:hypothetical protein
VAEGRLHGRRLRVGVWRTCAPSGRPLRHRVQHNGCCHGTLQQRGVGMSGKVSSWTEGQVCQERGVGSVHEVVRSD